MTGSEDDFGADNNYVTEDDMANGDQEDLSDYKFSKFAATYFTASVMHSYLRYSLWTLFLCSPFLPYRKLDAKSRSPYSIMMTKRTVPPPWPFGSQSYDSWATCLIRNRRHLIHLNAMNPSWAKFIRHLVEPHARNRSWLIKQSRKNRNLSMTGPFLGGNCTWHRNPALCNTQT